MRHMRQSTAWRKECVKSDVGDVFYLWFALYLTGLCLLELLGGLM